MSTPPPHFPAPDDADLPALDSESAAGSAATRSGRDDASAWAGVGITLLIAAATFLGAFLLFFLEPLIARFVLPWYGGSAGVWTTCLLFFQVCLLAGYAYTHALTRWLGPRGQVAVHAVLLMGAVALLPVTPGQDWKPTGSEAPVGHLLILLTACIGLPFLVLATTGPLLQAWLAALFPGRSPYRLYALSNAGSLLALISYPFVFEPWLSRSAQADLWAAAFVGFAGMNLAIGVIRWRARPSSSLAGAVSTPHQGASASSGGRIFWVALPACAALLMMATTNKLCEDLASVPFLWVLPLGIYLVTFILSFDSPVWYHRGLFQAGFWLWLPLLAYAVVAYESIPWPAHVGLYSVGLFLTCMICHGELYRLRPGTGELTGFYLFIAAGGALGGCFVAVLSPLLFRDYLELYVGLLLLAVLLLGIHVREGLCIQRRGRPVPVWPANLGGAVLLGVLLGGLVWGGVHRPVERHRDFYGVFRILEVQRDNPFYHARVFMSGGTIHGAQYQHPVKAAWPTTYYDRRSGIGLALERPPQPSPRRIGVVGLGIGTLAAYGRPDDTVRFYELSPYVAKAALTRFGYLTNSPARIQVVLGDARLSLEREAPQDFDVLVLDAFTSDAIPVHLLTREAFDGYRRHLKPGGVLAVHLSNRHLDLAPVVRRLAGHWGLPVAMVERRVGTDGSEAMSSTWALVTDKPALLALPGLRFSARDDPPESAALWTDDHVSLFPLLRYGAARD